uniref:Uncharacterized protein n=1 Tax=Vespula pensylvanica TaxID=30213 RepID=A0A834P741_VESPE|nr:hypothetical protein H0235_004241 [Vespula pensylvanica]
MRSTLEIGRPNELSNGVGLRCHVTLLSVGERTSKYIVCRTHRVRVYTVPEPRSVTAKRQIGWDKLISFTGDLGDPRMLRGCNLTSYAFPRTSEAITHRPTPLSSTPNNRTEQLGHGIHSSSGEGGNVLASQQLTTFRLLDSGFNTITAKPDIPRERRVYDNGYNPGNISDRSCENFRLTRDNERVDGILNRRIKRKAGEWLLKSTSLTCPGVEELSVASMDPGRPSSRQEDNASVNHRKKRYEALYLCVRVYIVSVQSKHKGIAGNITVPCPSVTPENHDSGESCPNCSTLSGSISRIISQLRFNNQDQLTFRGYHIAELTMDKN